MKSLLAAGAVALTLFGVAGYANREALTLAYLGARTPDTTLAAHAAFLAPHIEFLPPATGEAPYPAVIQFHGCAGPREAHMRDWARIANEAGYMAVIVNSNAARGVSREEALETICKGEALIGLERAGDVLAAFDLTASRRDVDDEKVFLAGWSHGAWSIMDFMTMDFEKSRPSQIAPLGAAEAPRAAPAGAILFYPYCGAGSRSRFADWRTDAPAIAFVAGEDTVVDHAECVTLFDDLKRRGQPITMTFYPDADHIFDDQSLPEEFQHYYNAGYARDAREKVAAFLRTAAE